MQLAALLLSLRSLRLEGGEMDRKNSLTIRLTDEQRARLQSASTFGPYKISLTEIVSRGIELAAQELERMEAVRKDGKT
jgi:hypothetical protein